MQRTALILFIAFELCYYLLIAQTGIVEYFHSDLNAIAYFPVGGVLGGLFVMQSTFPHRILRTTLLFMQTMMTFFYPDFSPWMLFVLGFSVGGIAPLLVETLRGRKGIEMGLALMISYTVGTSLFNIPPQERVDLALLFSVVALFCVYFLSPEKPYPEKENQWIFDYRLSVLMTLWVFLDSSLFETLSRDLSISIWRGGFSLEIVIFHILGIAAAHFFKIEKAQKEMVILMLFFVSYMLYFLHDALLLAIFYPFVISYYNMVILQNIAGMSSFKMIALSMVWIGWIASGAGLFVAITGMIPFVSVILIGALIVTIIGQMTFKKGDTLCLEK